MTAPCGISRRLSSPPHVSGFFHLRETLTRILQLCVENLTRWENGQPLLNRMDPQTGYRSTENRNVRL